MRSRPSRTSVVDAPRGNRALLVLGEAFETAWQRVRQRAAVAVRRGACSGLLALSALGVAGCGSGASTARPLPAYAGRATELFDDSIAPDALGVSLERERTPRKDPLLRERAQVADAALRVRIATITAREDDASATYDLTLHTVERVAGAHPPPEVFTVRVTPDSESFGLVRSRQERLIGMRFVAFVRAFVRPDGDEELRFRLEPDGEDVVAAVREATAVAPAR